MGTPTPVVIHGDGFVAQVVQSASGGGAQVNASHRAWLADVALEDVTWVDAHTLQATVPPGLPAGSLPLVVENPFGRRGRLENAFEVVATAGASLAATVELGAALVSVGEEIPVTVHVTNVGFAQARDVTATVAASSTDGAGVALVGPSPASVPTLDPGASTTLSWSCVATTAGQVTLSATGTATDSFSSGVIDSPAAGADLAIQLPAGLVATIAASRAVATTGQEVGVTLTVTNGGGADADLTDVAPSFSPGLATTCTVPTPAPPRTVASGQSAVFTWACTSGSPGNLSLSATVSGADGNSGAPLSATPAFPAAVKVVTPATLSASVTLPPGTSTVSVGQPILVTFTVSNSGGGAASLVSVTPTMVPASGAACGAPTPAPPYTLAGGASVSFTWTCAAAVTGTLTLGGAVSGADANTGAPLATSASGPAITAQLPAAIAAIVSASPTVASVGQPLAVTFTVTNGGSAAANLTAVTPSASGAAAATCGAVTPALPLSIASGTAQTFRWTCTPSTAGTLSLSGTATGTDGNSGAPISATPATPASVTVQTPADVRVSAFTATPTTVSAGQAIGVSLTLANAGGASAAIASVTPSIAPAAGGSCTAASPAPPLTLAGGASRTFTWSCSTTTTGTTSLGVTVSSSDVNSGATSSLTPPTLPVTVQAPAALQATFTAAAATIDAGQPDALTLTLTNTGGATANVTAITPSVSPATGASCTAPTPAPPQSIAGGASRTFTWSCTATATGATLLRAAVVAADANSGSALSVPVTDVPVTVQTPAALTATIAAAGNPPSIAIGSPLSLTLTVQDTGQAGANVTAVTPTVAPAGAAGCTAPTPSPPRLVAGGTSVAFSWTCTASTAGTVTFGATVAGTDANSGAAVAATASPGVSVLATAPAALTATVVASRGVATVGQSVGVTFTLTNGGSGTANVTSVTPSATGAAATCGPVSPALPQSIAPGAALVFTWSCVGSAPGSLALSGVATGTDVSTGTPISATPTTAATVTVQSPPALSASAFSASGKTANVGQAVTVALTVQNGGGATAVVASVSPTFSPDGAGTCTPASPPPPIAILGGGSATFGWSCTGTAAASDSLGVTLAATDANTGAATPFSVSPLSLTVQQPAALADPVFAVTPALVTVGQPIAASLTLSNTGGAGAVVTSIAPTVSPPSAAACGTPSPALPVTIAGGTSRTFTWSCAPSAAGSVTLGATVAASDANTGAALSSTVPGATTTVVVPASLSASVAISGNPSTVSVGTPLSITLTVSDPGGAGATVTAVTPTVSGTGAATCGAPAPAPPVGLASGGSASFTFSCTPTAPGLLTLGATVAGVDAVSGAALAAAASATVTAQSPAALSASLAAGRSVASVGQAVSVTLTVTDTGGAGATVTGVVPTTSGAGSTCTAPTPAPPVSLSAGKSATFGWSCTPTAAGTMTLGATVSGVDANSGATLAASAAPVNVTVQAAASLAVTVFSASRTTADPGQQIGLSMTVANVGAATAQLSAVTPTMDPTGSASCTAAVPAPPQTLAGGASLTFTWSCAPSITGTVSLGATVAATDANSGSSANATATPIPVLVQAPAALSGTVVPTPATQLIGLNISFALTLTNTGGATASVTGVTPTLTPKGNSSCSGVTPAPPQSIPGGQSLLFTWTCTSPVARSTTASATVTATDANTGASAPATVGSVSVSWVTTLPALFADAGVVVAPLSPVDDVVLVTSDVLGDATAAGAILAAGGGVLVGLDATGGALVRFDPAGGPATRIDVAFGVDAGATPAANAAWLASAPATTLGAPGCAPGSRACGPDDEAGLAAVAAGVVRGTERVVLAGAGATRYLYAGSPATSPLEAAWIDLGAVLPAGAAPGMALLASSTLDALVVAAPAGGGARVLALPRVPNWSGLDVVPGADLLDLGAAAPAGGGAPTLAEIAGALYVAGGPGLAIRDPSCAGGWCAATPSGEAWTARTPASTSGATLWPGERAVPALAGFGACGVGPCVLAARNVAGTAAEPGVLPQLWECAPRATAGACTPGDWTLVAPDPADPQVSRLGAPGLGAISLVAATARWLYVGLDDTQGGARLYRSPRAPSAASDFQGLAGCSAASSTCEGLGGNGLGVGATRFAGAARTDTGGVATLWILVGDGAGPLRLLRIAD